MNYRELKPEENEHLSAEDEKIRQLCGGLKRVRAPKDFDFRLKARIAAHKPQNAKSPFLAFLRYAAPLGLVLAILGVIVSNNLYSVDDTAVPSLAQSSKETPRTVENPQIQDKTQQPSIAKINGPNADSENETAKSDNTAQTFSFSTRNTNEIVKLFDSSKNNRASEDGSSRNSASTQPRVLTPQSFNSNKVVETANFSKPTTFSVRDILSFIGIEAVFTTNGWRVQSVRQSSTAERSGIQPNDFIEAVNDIKILTETIQTNSISGKRLTVVRDGKRLEIVLK